MIEYVIVHYWYASLLSKAEQINKLHFAVFLTVESVSSLTLHAIVDGFKNKKDYRMLKKNNTYGAVLRVKCLCRLQ